MARKDTGTNAATKQGIHQQLKDVMARELEKLPELLEGLPPQERIKAVLQLLPYTAPKVESCTADFGEPSKGWGW